MASIRGTDIQAANASSYVIPWPSGTLAGDLAVIMGGHAWPINAPSGWATNDNQSTGSAWLGAVFSKILTAADITAGSVTVTTGGGFNGVFGIVTLVGSTGIYILPVVSQRNGTGSSSISLIAPSGSSGIPGIYWGSNRGASTNTVDRGTQQRQINDGSAASGCIYTEAGSPPSATSTFFYSTPGSGNYQALIIVASSVTPTGAGNSGYTA